MSVQVLPNRETHRNLLGFERELVSIFFTISTTSSLNFFSSRRYEYCQSSMQRPVVDVTYASWIIEIPDSNNVSMNYGKTIPYCVSFEVRAGHQGFPVPCYQGQSLVAVSMKTELCLPTLRKSKDVITITLEGKPYSMVPLILRLGTTLCAISVTNDVMWASAVLGVPT